MALMGACRGVVQHFRDLMQRRRHQDRHLGDKERQLASTSAMRVAGEREEVAFASGLGERFEVCQTAARCLDILQLHNHLERMVSVLDIKEGEL
jgi:hypothetical protein